MNPTVDNRNTDGEALAGLAREVDAAFTVERALLRQPLTERVAQELPRQAPAAVRAARILTGAVLLASLAVAALGAHLAGTLAGTADPAIELKVFLGVGCAMLAVLLSFAAPRLAIWECQLRGRLAGKELLPRPVDVLLARLAALCLSGAGWALLHFA